MSTDASDYSDEDISALRIKEQELQLQLVAAKRRLAEKRKRATVSSPTDKGLEPPQKKKATQPQIETHPRNGSAIGRNSISPSTMTSSIHHQSESEEAPQNSETVARAFEYYRNRLFKVPPEGMITMRPKGNLSLYQSSPWFLRDENDGRDQWKLFRRFVRKEVENLLDISKQWLQQNKSQINLLISKIKMEYPVLTHQNSPFTIIGCASAFLRGKSKAEKETASKPSQQRATPSISTHSEAVSGATTSGADKTTGIPNVTEIGNTEQEAPIIRDPTIDPQLYEENINVPSITLPRSEISDLTMDEVIMDYGTLDAQTTYDLLSRPFHGTVSAFARISNVMATTNAISFVNASSVAATTKEAPNPHRRELDYTTTDTRTRDDPSSTSSTTVASSSNLSMLAAVAIEPNPIARPIDVPADPGSTGPAIVSNVVSISESITPSDLPALHLSKSSNTLPSDSADLANLSPPIVAPKPAGQKRTFKRIQVPKGSPTRRSGRLRGK